MDGDGIRASGREPINPALRFDNHQVDIDPQACPLADCLEHWKANRDIRYEPTIHDVNVNVIRTSLRNNIEIGTEIEKPRREDRRTYFNIRTRSPGCGHMESSLGCAINNTDLRLAQRRLLEVCRVLPVCGPAIVRHTTPLLYSCNGLPPQRTGSMGILDKVEHSIERLFEGTTNGLLRQSLQPAEIGKKLERSMVSQKRASIGTSIVPNTYIVRMHPRDFAQFEDYAQGLCRQMEAWLAQFATQRNYSVIDRIRVSIEADESVKRRSPVVVSRIADSQQPAFRSSRQSPQPSSTPAQATSVFNVVRTSAGRVTLDVSKGSLAGTSFTISEGSSTIGRSEDNTLVLHSPDVSRRHARFEYSSGRLRIYDLNSTNGTRVNGEAVRVSDLVDGDEVGIGGQTLTVTGSGTSPDGFR